MRCSPSVVPLLPPTGAAGVVSLKPTPAALALMMVMVAAACAAPIAPNDSASAATMPFRLLFNVMLVLLSFWVRDCSICGFFASHALHDHLAIGVFGDDGVDHRLFT